MSKQPMLQLSSPDVADFIKKAPTPAAGSTAPVPASRALPKPIDASLKRGHVVQASGKVVRRLVVNIDPQIGAELERRHVETGASLSRIAGDLLRSALGL